MTDAERLPVKRTAKLFIGGKFPRSESGRSFEVLAPNGRSLGHAAQASRKDLRDAVEAARGAQPGWRYCQKCQGLWLSTGVGTGSCPAGGLHDKAGSSEYSLAFEQYFIAPLAATALSATSGDPGTRVVVSVRDGAGNPVKGLAGNTSAYFARTPSSPAGPWRRSTDWMASISSACLSSRAPAFAAPTRSR